MTNTPTVAATIQDAQVDERVAKPNFIRLLLSRPEIASLAGALLVFAIFGYAARGSGMFAIEGIVNWAQVAAYLGIIACGACLLMIGGEFDLSLGSMIGFSGMAIAIPSLYFHWPLSVALLFALFMCLGMGWLNGMLVVKTQLPSFIVTLAFLFILRGLSLALSIRYANKTIVSGISDLAENDGLAKTLFVGHTAKSFFSFLGKHHFISTLDSGEPIVGGIPKVVVWWLVVASIFAFVLAKTRFGNWVQAVGGDANSSKNVGVPVGKVKVALFMLSAFCAFLFSAIQVCDLGSAAADRGTQKEFEAIIAAVIGGTLLTGGHGSIVGASLGALIFGVVQVGITYTDVSADWFRVFLGLMLLIAVLFNNAVRRRLTQGQKS